MRSEITKIIETSGTISEEEIKIDHANFLRESSDLSAEEIERLINDNKTIDHLHLIHQIFLEDKGISDEEIDEISKTIVTMKPQTREIYLGSNRLSDKGILLMCNHFKELEHLEFLCLTDNKIGEKGFYDLYLLQAHRPDLELSLRGNKIIYANQCEKIKHKALKDYKNAKRSFN